MNMHGALRGLRKISTAMKKVPGAVLVLEPVRRAFAKLDQHVTVHDFDGELTMTLALADHMHGQIFWNGFYSRDIVLLLDRLLDPGMVVLDVGANVGEITLAAAKRVGASGRVVSFEPVAHLHAQLLTNAAANAFEQVLPVKAGALDQPGSADIYVAAGTFRDGTSHSGLGTLYSSSITSESMRETIDITTIDDVVTRQGLNRVDVIKLDIEGAELPALRGAGATLAKYGPVLIIEIQDETAGRAGYRAADLLGYLDQFGYRYFTIGRKARLRPVTVATLRDFQNVVCVQDEAAQRLSPLMV